MRHNFKLWWGCNVLWNFHAILEFLPQLYIIANSASVRRALFASDWNQFCCNYAVWIVCGGFVWFLVGLSSPVTFTAAAIMLLVCKTLFPLKHQQDSLCLSLTLTLYRLRIWDRSKWRYIQCAHDGWVWCPADAVVSSASWSYFQSHDLWIQTGCKGPNLRNISRLMQHPNRHLSDSSSKTMKVLILMKTSAVSEDDDQRCLFNGFFIEEQNKIARTTSPKPTRFRNGTHFQQGAQPNCMMPFLVLIANDRCSVRSSSMQLSSSEEVSPKYANTICPDITPVSVLSLPVMMRINAASFVKGRSLILRRMALRARKRWTREKLCHTARIKRIRSNRIKAFAGRCALHCRVYIFGPMLWLFTSYKSNGPWWWWWWFIRSCQTVVTATAPSSTLEGPCSLGNMLLMLWGYVANSSSPMRMYPKQAAQAWLIRIQIE